MNESAPIDDAPPPSDRNLLGPRLGRGGLRRLDLLAATIVSLFVVVAFGGARWRVDLGHDAIWGYPRLFGIWTAKAAFLWWIGALPALLLGWLFLRPRDRRRAPIAALVVWAATSLALVVLERFLVVYPQTLLAPQIQYLPYRGYAVFPWGERFMTHDHLLFVRHRPGAVYRTTADFGRQGDILESGFVRPPGPEVAPNVIEARRRIGDEGFPAEFGGVGRTQPPPEIVFLGDSFTFGYNIPAEKAWPAQLLSDLAARGEIGTGPPERAAPLRLGAVYAHGDATPIEGLLHLRTRDLSAPPRLVIALFYEGNDLLDMHLHQELRGAGRDYRTEFARAEALAPSDWPTQLPLHAAVSWLFAFTDFRLPAAARQSAWKRTRRAANEQAMLADPLLREYLRAPAPFGGVLARPARARRVVLDGEHLPMAITPFDLINLAWGPKWPLESGMWDDFLWGLDELADFQERTKIPVFVALAPNRLRLHLPHLAAGELDGEEIVEFPGNMALPPMLERAREENSWRPQVEMGAGEFACMMGEACAERALPFVDLAEGLRRESEKRGALLYWPYDSHWSIEGHAAAADVIGEAIRTKGLLARP